MKNNIRIDVKISKGSIGVLIEIFEQTIEGFNIRDAAAVITIGRLIWDLRKYIQKKKEEGKLEVKDKSQRYAREEAKRYLKKEHRLKKQELLTERSFDDGYEFTFENSKGDYICTVYKNCDLHFRRRRRGLDNYIA